MSEYNSNDAVNYWNEMNFTSGHSCPNVSLFRFLGYGGIDIFNKKVLEIGFEANRGKDLLECQNRGATIYGADINRSYLDDFQKSNPSVPIALMNAGKDEFPFEVNFDLIFHRDVIYYLSDEEIKFHFINCHKNLNAGGFLAFQFIERDIFVNREQNPIYSHKLDFDTLKNAESNKMFRGEKNPLRTLEIDWLIKLATEMGFRLCSTKTCLESYTPDESVYRVDRYLLLKKISCSN